MPSLKTFRGRRSILVDSLADDDAESKEKENEKRTSRNRRPLPQWQILGKCEQQKIPIRFSPRPSLQKNHRAAVSRTTPTARKQNAAVCQEN